MIAALLAALLAAPAPAARPAPPATQAPAAPIAVGNLRGTPSATSTLAHKDPRRYAPANAFDGNPATAWVEGVAGLGKGEAVRIAFDKPVAIDGVLVVAGYAKSPQTLTDNGVPTRLALSLDKKDAAAFDLFFARSKPTDPDKDPGCRISAATVNLAVKLVVLKQKSRPIKELALRIEAAEQVGKFDETAISEVLPIVDGAPLVVAGRSYAPAAKALIALRNRAAAALGAGANVAVDALAEFPQQAEGLHPKEPFDKWMQAQSQFDTSGTPEAWVQLFGPHLLQKAVTVVPQNAGLRLIGPQVFRHGDGEWVELYPTIELDAQGRVTALRRAFYVDAAPGCRNVLPQ